MAQHTDDPSLPPAEEQSSEDLPLVDLETILNRQPSRRKRLIQISLLLVAAVVALVMFWGSSLSGRPAAPALAPTPTSSPPMLLILSNVNYGTLTINGKQQPGQIPMLVAMHGDTYNITLNAPPFLPKSCQVRLAQGVSSNSNACQAAPVSSTSEEMLNGMTVAPAFELDIYLTLDDLPPEQQSKVTALLTQSLTSQQDLTVSPGSYFATRVDASGKITSRRATAPLRASAIIAPFTPWGHGPSGPCTGLICAAGLETQTASSFTGPLWDIRIGVALRWRFSSASGVVISEVQFQQANAIALSLSYNAAAGWSAPSATPLAGTIDDQLASTFSLTGLGILEQLAPTDTMITTGTSFDKGAQGCEMVLDVNGVDQGLYLWRFGVLLAADKKAHAAHPELPVAPPAELAAVEQP